MMDNFDLEIKIKEYQDNSSNLEPTPEMRAYLLGNVINYTEDFLRQIYTLPAFNESADNGRGIINYNITDQPESIEQIIDAISTHVDKPGLNPASGGHLAYIPGGGLFGSALGDYLADIMNKYSGVYFAGPGPVRLENMLCRWLCDIAGYPENAAGNLTSGGSVANLTGIVTAREAFDLKSRDIEKSVIYSTVQAHHSIDKSIRIAGLGECIRRIIPMDERFRMIPGKLNEAINEDKVQGLNPFLVITSAGTTDTGSVDPLDEISDICSVHNLWHHCDGAYGAFFLLSDLVRDVLKGIDRTDSLVMDPHKGLFLPYGTGSVLIRDKEKMFKAHHHTANYMQDAMARQEEISPHDLSPEMSKHFRALRLWVPMKLAGLDAFKAALNEKILLTRYFYEKIQEIDGFEVGIYPELSIATYRYIPEYGDADNFNARIITEVLKDGRVFLSSTIINGRFTLRMAVLHFRTHLDTIDTALEVLKEKVDYIKNNI